MSVVGVLFPWVLNSFHWLLLRLARASLNGSTSVVSPVVAVVVDLICIMVSLIIGIPENMTFSRFILLHSGASSRLLFGWCWIVDVNPTSRIRGHENLKVSLSSGGVVLNSILHLGRVPPGIEL